MGVWSAFQPAPEWNLHIAVLDGAICQLAMRTDEHTFLELLRRRFSGHRWERDDGDPMVQEAATQLERYFRGELRQFRLPLSPRGTRFQKRVWAALETIPYGETRSYSEIARQIGAPKAFRAVGAANGQNPIGIVIPCHRVIAADGSLCGFGGGLDYKQRLLDLERNGSE